MRKLGSIACCLLTAAGLAKVIQQNTTVKFSRPTGRVTRTK
jgi:hypothetical protein